MPLFDRGPIVVTDECIKDDGADWLKLIWILDARNEQNFEINKYASFPLWKNIQKGGRFGSHNVHENRPGPFFIVRR